MNIDELIEEYGVERQVAVKAVRANGFQVDATFDGDQYHLITLYLDYLEAMDEAKEQRRAFKYTDGEESVDKSGVYDKFRRYAMDLFSAWTSAKRDYDNANRGLDSFYTVRGRHGAINAKSR